MNYCLMRNRRVLYSQLSLGVLGINLKNTVLRFIPLLILVFSLNNVNAQLAWVSNCNEMYLEMGVVEEIDCYQLKVPFFLKTPNTAFAQVNGYDFNFNIEFEYANMNPAPILPIEVVEVVIPNAGTPDAECTSYNSGFTDVEIVGSSHFTISSTPSDDEFNPTTFSLNCETPSFYAVIEILPGASFTAKTINFPNNLNSFKIVQPNTQCVDDLGADLNDPSDDVIEVSLVATTITASSPANCNSTNTPLSVVVDVDNATDIPADISNGTGQRKVIPVKLRSSQSGNLSLERLDFKIDYQNIDGDLVINEIENYENSGLDDNNTPPIIGDGYIYGALTDFSDASSLTMTSTTTNGGLTVYEHHLFDLEVEAPHDPPAGGTMNFSGDFARVIYVGDVCCLPDMPSSSIDLDEFERPCLDPAPDLVISREEDENEIIYTVAIEDGSTNGTITLSDLYFELEMITNGGYVLDVTDTEDSQSSECPYGIGESCSNLGYPSDGCLEVNGNVVTYGMCRPSHTINYGITLFTIHIDKNSQGTESLRVNRAVWTQDNFTACIPNVKRCNRTYGKVSQLSLDGNAFEKYPIEGVNFCLSEDASLGCVGCNNCGGVNSTSNIDGDFDFRQCGPTPISACYDNEEMLCNISTFDLIIISQHILGVDLFDYTWQYFAADVNGSQNVTTLDLIEIRKVILSIETEYPNAPNFRMLPCDLKIDGYGLEDPLPGLIDPWATSIDLDCFTLDYGLGDACFYGIKTGDVVNDDAEDCGEEVISTPTTTITVIPQNITTAAQAIAGKIALGVAPNGSTFSNISSFQLAIGYNTNKLSFDEIKTRNLSYVDGDIYHLVEPGLLKIAWFDEGGSSQGLTSSQYAMELVFDRLGLNNITASDIWIDYGEMPAVIYKSDGSRHQLVLPGSGLSVDDNVAHEQYKAVKSVTVRPNPVSGDFNLYTSSDLGKMGTIFIYNTIGELILEKELDLSNTVHQLSSDEWQPGVYYLQLNVEGETYTQSIIKQ